MGGGLRNAALDSSAQNKAASAKLLPPHSNLKLREVLLLNQCFYPDVMATAQQLTQLAVGLAKEGHQVTVIAGDRGYDDPTARFGRRETWQGITIIRIPSLALGKHSKWRRAVTFASFLMNCSLRLLLLPRFDGCGPTSPPLIPLGHSLFR